MQLTKTESLRQAQQLLDQGRVSSAIRIYQQIVDEDPSDLNVISMLGDLYVKANRTSDAVDHFLRIAGKYLKGGSAKSAAYMLNKAIKLAPENPRVQVSLGELHLHDKDIGKAHDAFIEAAAAYWHENNVAAAIGTNQRALEIMPESRQARAALEFIKHEMEPPPPPEPKKREIAVVDLPAILISIPDGSDDVCAPVPPPVTPQVTTVLAPVVSQPQSDFASDFDDSPVQREFVPGRDEDSIVRQIAVAEFLVGCGQVDKAISLLRGSLIDQPDHIPTREKIKDIYLRSEMTDKAGEECVNIAAIYLARGETSRGVDYIARARLLSSSGEQSSPLQTTQSGRVNNAEGIQETGSESRTENEEPVQVM
jgi:predicted Zn-dependent protease